MDRGAWRVQQRVGHSWATKHSRNSVLHVNWRASFLFFSFVVKLCVFLAPFLSFPSTRQIQIIKSKWAKTV